MPELNTYRWGAVGSVNIPRHPAVVDISPPDGSGSHGSSLPRIAGHDNDDLEPLVGLNEFQSLIPRRLELVTIEA
jgi:hypothetical protein